jgi:hypothetical protein
MRWFLWLGPSVLGLISQIYQREMAAPSLFRSYADDLLIVPICLGIWQTSLYLLARRELKKGELIWAIAIGVVWFSLLFEWVMPSLGKGSADGWDILAYAAGGSIYFWLSNSIPIPKRAKS